jgi:hypothetical protein
MRMGVVGMVAAMAVLAGGSGARADVQINIGIGMPAPPAIVLPAPPRLVVVPSTPAVRYAPDLDVNYFVYGGRYYTFHDGAWFMASVWSGPWAYVETVRVPRAIRIVPARYYRVPPRYVAYRGHPHGLPPGQAKKLYGTPPPGHVKHGHKR